MTENVKHVDVLQGMRESWAEIGSKAYDPFVAACDAAIDALQREAAGDGEALESQVDRLAKFIMAEIPGEPSESEGAVDTAIRWMRARLGRKPRPKGTDEIDPSSASFREGFSVGRAESEFMCGLLKDPKCHSCGARNEKEAESMCRPSGDSCPGTEWPLSNIWALTTPASAEPDLPNKRERLEDERWRMMNNFGHGAFEDGLTQARIDAIDAELAKLPDARGGGEAVAWQYRYAGNLPNGGKSSWQWCSREEYERYKANAYQCGYDIRALYTHPTPAALDAESGLSAEVVDAAFGIATIHVDQSYFGPNMIGPGKKIRIFVIDAARATTGANGNG